MQSRRDRALPQNHELEDVFQLNFAPGRRCAMSNFMKKMFGIQTADDRMFRELLAKTALRAERGAEIANDCLENGLRKGEIVKFSDISRFIAAHYEFDKVPIETIFLTRMKEIEETEEVVHFNMENNGDFIFVHRRDITSFVNRITTGDSGSQGGRSGYMGNTE
jgi:hypothetical protein